MALNSSSAADVVPTSPAFRLKGGLFPLTLLEIRRYSQPEFEQDLLSKVAEAPAFFQQTPVILSFEMAVAEAEQVPLAELVELCRSNGLRPVALRGGSKELKQQAETLQLALMPEGRVKVDAAVSPEGTAEPVAAKAAATDAAAGIDAAAGGGADRPADSAENGAGGGNKIITTPIRSGQQVYAAGGDLIVLAAVSTGAEVLADGNIHIYGALRGRALAGVRGDTSARIFCQSLEAELISIAGDFKLHEDFRGQWWKKPVQVSLTDDILAIEALSK